MAVNVDAKNNEGGTPLEAAELAGHKHIAGLLQAHISLLWNFCLYYHIYYHDSGMR